MRRLHSFSVRAGNIILRTALICTLLAAVCALAAHSYMTNTVSPADLVSAAKTEKTLVVYSTIHAKGALADILNAFRRRYPFLSIQDSDGETAATYARFTREVGAGRPSADFVWTEAMDLQEKLINDGFAQAYSSPEMASLPQWAHWQNFGYGTTLEPVVFVYNNRFLSAGEMPRTHADLEDLLRKNPERYRGRVATYNPEKSAVGMLVLSQDIHATPDAWGMFSIFGALNAHYYDTSRSILNHILSGEQWLGYDVIASYAVEMQKAHHELAIIYPSDYVLTLSQVGFVAASAKHPSAAKLFLDFLLSEQGQKILKSHSIGSVRADIGVPEGQPRLDSARAQVVRIGPGLLSDLDSLVRAQFLRRWQAALKPAKTVAAEIEPQL